MAEAEQDQQPPDWVSRAMKQLQGNEKLASEMRSAGVTTSQISRRVMEMIGQLHRAGFEELYLDCRMAPSGVNWRYEIGLVDHGRWPSNKRLAEGSIGNGFDQTLPWCDPSDDLSTFVAKFRLRYRDQLVEAKNSAYVDWYAKMLRDTGPEGMLIFYADHSPDHQYAIVRGAPDGFQMPMPPGYRRAW